MTEVQWYFVRWIPDLLRKEPRNVGLLVRVAQFEEDILITRFVGEKQATVGKDKPPTLIIEKLPRWLQETTADYTKLVRDLREAIEKYGIKAMNWIPKKYKGQRYHIILGGAQFTDAVDVDEMWKEMVA